MGFGTKAGFGPVPTVCVVQLTYKVKQGEAQTLIQAKPTYTVVVS